MPRWENRTPAEIAEATEHARRASRFKFAEDRIRKIIDAAPPLTAAQLDQLALLLTAPGDDRAAAS